MMKYRKKGFRKELSRLDGKGGDRWVAESDDSHDD